MCGINGFNFTDLSLIKKMNKEIDHRGPDDSGIFMNDQVTLGHLRLSIIDLSQKGHQPMGLKIIDNNINLIFEDSKINDADLVIVYNGEIYNFKDIKDELNITTESESDTEILLKGYLKLGKDIVKKLNGMWAFSIYDKRNSLIFCSRDRFGKKPLYYHIDGNKFIFSSELKSILQYKEINKIENIDIDALDLFFTLGFIPSPYTIYKDTFKLEPRQNLIFNLRTSSLEKEYYYEIPDFKPNYNKKELINNAKELIKDSVNKRLISDVPLGAFLSGGLDSTSVVGEVQNFIDLKNFHTFSIGFEGKYDESNYIQIAKNYYKTIHHHYYYFQEDFEKKINEYSFIYDEPFGDFSGFPTEKISEMARNEITVVLSGDGGDEVFGGYSDYQMGAQFNIILKFPYILRLLASKIPAKRNLNKNKSLYYLKKAFKTSLSNPEEFFSNILEDDQYISPVFREWSSSKFNYCLNKANNNFVEALRLYDILYRTLPDNYLVKVDRASMYHSLEVRCPLLDYRLVNFSQTIPTKYKASLRKTKILMRDIVSDLIPNEIISRGKKGFVPPLEQWILDDKFEQKINMYFLILKDLNPKLHSFFKEKVLNEDNKVSLRYKIRLFIFGEWFNKWIKS